MQFSSQADNSSLSSTIPHSHKQIYLLFFFSGATGLIYEVIWIRIIGLIVGNTIFSITTVVVAFMAGLAIGSYIGGKYSENILRPVLWYGILEAGIGLFALIIPEAINTLTPIFKFAYQNSNGNLAIMTSIKFLFCVLLLIIPTSFMGATLPLLAQRLSRPGSSPGKTAGNLYAANTIGAVFGTGLVGFMLLPYLGTNWAIRLTALLNILIFFYAGYLSLTQERPSSVQKTKIPKPNSSISTEKMVRNTPDRQRLISLTAYAFSGFAAMVYQLAWIRGLILVFGSTVYVFSIILCGFITGLSLGSFVMAKQISKIENKFLLFGITQALIGLSSMIITNFFDLLPFYAAKLFIKYNSIFWLLQAGEYLSILILLIVPTFFMGAAFPLAASIYTGEYSKTGKDLGTLYAGNTLGAIAGSIAGGFIFIPFIGLASTLTIATSINLILGIILSFNASRKMPKVKMTVIITSLIFLVLLGFHPPAWDKNRMDSAPFLEVDLFKKLLKAKSSEREKLLKKGVRIPYYREGANTTVTVMKSSRGELSLKVNGKPDASLDDLHTQILLGQIPMMLHPDPNSVAVIGLGSGITLASVLTHPMSSVDCIEISSAVVEGSRFFDQYDNAPLDDPRTRLITGDGRNHLLLSGKKYDIVISEPSNPWISGVSTLFTREFFNIVKDRLAKNGIFAQWLHYSRLNPADFLAIVKTFQMTFPNSTLWRTRESDLLLVGFKESHSIDFDLIKHRFRNATIANDLKKLNITEPENLLFHFLMGPENMKIMSRDAHIHTDNNLFLEFSLPKLLYSNQNYEINQLINNYLESPNKVLKGPIDANVRINIERIYLSNRAFSSSEKSSHLGENLEKNNHLLRALELYPKNMEAAESYTSMIYRNKIKPLITNNPKEAIVEMEKIIKINPLNQNYQLELALLYKKLNRIDDAALILKNILKRYKENIEAAVALAEIEAGRGEHEIALEGLQKMDRVFPSFSPLIESKAMIHYKSGDYAAAAEEYHRAIMLKPKEPELYYNLGLVYLNLRQNKKAEIFFRKTLSFNPQHKFAQAMLRSLPQP